MKGDHFIYKTHCEIGIVSDEFSPKYITNNLGIIPTRTFRKGEQSVSKHSGTIIIKPHNLWAFKSAPTNLKGERINQHIEYFKSIFLSKMDILKQYKEDNRFDVTFWIWIETDNVGIGIDINEDEFCFLNSISNRVHFSIICGKELMDK